VSTHRHGHGLVRPALGQRHAVTLALSTSLVGACASAPNAPLAAATTEGPESAILRIASTWEARHTEKGLLSSPSPVASFDRQVVSRLVLISGEGVATESSTFTERFVLRDGREVRCSDGFAGEVTVAYGTKAGEPALDVAWPALQHQRDCGTAEVSVPDVGRAAGRARFVLRSDRLVGVEPAREKRTFVPAD
jgi:hypothetical protein